MKGLSLPGLAGLFLVAATMVAPPAHALSVGQVDTFEDGTTQGWTANLLGMGSHPAPPINVAGGPDGAGDHSLLVRAVGGAGSGSRLSAINFMGQWAGDYLAAGITAIAMDVRNFSTADLYLRLVFEDPTVGPPENIAYSADPILLPAGSEWTSILFPVGVPDLAAGLGDVTVALTNTTAVRLYHSFADNFPNPIFPIETVTAELGVDNIRAVGAKVPAAHSTLPAIGSMLALLGCLAQLARRGPIHGLAARPTL